MKYPAVWKIFLDRYPALSRVMDSKVQSTSEKDIVFEDGDFWVLDTGDSYAVMKNGVTHSESDSEYAHDPDGLSIAIARCKYLARAKKKAPPAESEYRSGTLGSKK